MKQPGERENTTVIPCFNRSIHIDFQGAKISSDTGVLMLREIDERFHITAPLTDHIANRRRASHLRHTYVDLIRQRVYQMAAGYEDCNDANHLRIDSALRLTLGKDEEYAASQSMLSRFAAGKVVRVYKGRAEIENRIKEGKNALRWDRTSCTRFEANEARLKMGVLACNFLHMLRKFYIRGEGVWHLHVSTAFALVHHYQEVFDPG